MEKKHRILDHTIISYFLLGLFVMICTNLGGAIDTVIAGFLPGYAQEVTVSGTTTQTASGVGVAIGALAAAGIFYLRFRPEYKGILKKKDLKTGLLMLLPFLLFHWAGSVVSWITLGTGNVLIAFLRAFAPGFGEEITYRGLGVANYMRTIRNENQITVIFWLSSLTFGLTHLLNATVGGDMAAVAVQSVYAIFIGMLFGAVYLRTGTLWPTILGHFSVDFMEFVRSDLNASGGLMLGMGIGDWITVGASLLALALALRMMNKKYYPQIMQLWAEKWSRDDTEAEAL